MALVELVVVVIVVVGGSPSHILFPFPPPPSPSSRNTSSGLTATVEGGDLSEFTTFAATRKHFTENVSDSECEILVGLVKDLMAGGKGREREREKEREREREREREKEREREREKEKEKEKEKERERERAGKEMGKGGPGKEGTGKEGKERQIGAKLERLSSSVAIDVQQMGDEAVQMRSRVGSLEGELKDKQKFFASLNSDSQHLKAEVIINIMMYFKIIVNIMTSFIDLISFPHRFFLFFFFFFF